MAQSVLGMWKHHLLNDFNIPADIIICLWSGLLRGQVKSYWQEKATTISLIGLLMLCKWFISPACLCVILIDLWLLCVFSHCVALAKMKFLLLQISNVCVWGRRPKHPCCYSSGQRSRWWWYNLLHNSRQRGRKLRHWQPERWYFLIFSGRGIIFAALTVIDRLSVKSHIQFSLIRSC